MNPLERLLKKTNGRVDVRNFQDTMADQCKKRGLKVPTLKTIQFNCHFCEAPKCNHQVATRFGRQGNQIKPMGRKWICEDCLNQLKAYSNL